MLRMGRMGRLSKGKKSERVGTYAGIAGFRRRENRARSQSRASHCARKEPQYTRERTRNLTMRDESRERMRQSRSALGFGGPRRECGVATSNAHSRLRCVGTSLGRQARRSPGTGTGLTRPYNAKTQPSRQPRTPSKPRRAVAHAPWPAAEKQPRNIEVQEGCPTARRGLVQAMTGPQAGPGSTGR
jgi:hypothetical protein